MRRIVLAASVALLLSLPLAASLPGLPDPDETIVAAGSMISSDCGYWLEEAVAGVKVSVGSDCGAWGYSYDAGCSSAPTGFNCTLTATARIAAAKWLHGGAMTTQILGACNDAASASDSWMGLDGVAPRARSVHCEDSFLVSRDTCVTRSLRWTFEWTGANAPPPYEFDSGLLTFCA